MIFGMDSEAIARVVATGLFSGLGSTIGGYVATTYGVRKIEALIKRVRPAKRRR